MKSVVSFASLVLFAGGALAGDISNLSGLLQPAFKDFSKDLTAALSHKPLQPSEAMGITGFDVGVGLSYTQFENTSAWQTATGSLVKGLPVPKVFISKGLPFDVNVGAFYSAIPTTNIKLYGVDVGYAIMAGSTLTPALTLRGAYTKLAGVDQLDFSTKSVDLSMSKGFAFLTPYAGFGYVWADSQPNVAVLTKESVGVSKMFAGLNINLGLVNMAVEADKTGDNNTYSAKLGLRF